MTPITKPIVEAAAGGLVGVGVGVNNAIGLMQTSMGPGTVFGAEAAWQWALLLSAAALVWRAGALVRGVENTLQNFAEKAAAAAEAQREADQRILERVEANEKKWRHWEPVLIEWQIRARVSDENHRGSA